MRNKPTFKTSMFMWLAFASIWFFAKMANAETRFFTDKPSGAISATEAHKAIKVKNGKAWQCSKVSISKSVRPTKISGSGTLYYKDVGAGLKDDGDAELDLGHKIYRCEELEWNDETHKVKVVRN